MYVKIWLFLREEYSSGVFQNWVLKRIFEPTREELKVS
jgi:hypothetical protein